LKIFPCVQLLTSLLFFTDYFLLFCEQTKNKKMGKREKKKRKQKTE